MLKKLENTAKEFTSLDDYLTVFVIRITKKLNELVDAHNELLDTHTVKVKEEHLCLNGVVGTTCNNPECQPTTPEKKPHTAPMKKCKICKMDYCPECFEFCPMCPQPAVFDQHQKETATPEKKCCEEVEICCSHNGNFTGETSEIDNYTGRKCVCTCHQVKLPTSSYEVTCGRCEKSIKHSCGRV